MFRQDSITIAGKSLPLIARKHPRARHLRLTYDAKKKCVKLTLPQYVAFAQGVAFAESKAGWIESQIQKNHAFIFSDEAVILLFGEEVTLQHMGGRGTVTRADNRLYVHGSIDFFERRVRDYIQAELRKECMTRALYHGQKIGVQPSNISVRDTTSRWGSCSASGALSFSLRLAHVPLEVLDYVICHEVAHLVHHNHSDAFWDVVEQLCPDYRTQEKWLKHKHAF